MNKEKDKKANMLTAVGVLQCIGGVLTATLFGAVNLVTAVFSGAFTACISGASPGFPTIFVIGLLLGGIIIMMGGKNLKTANSFKKISRAVGDSEVISFINLERRVYLSRKQLIKLLKRQMKNGFWPNAHLDMTNELFVVDYEPPADDVTESSAGPAPDGIASEVHLMLHEIRAAGQKIEDEQLKGQVDTLADIAEQIYSHIAKHPDKAERVRRLSNYFLPTTVGLLVQYVELQNQTVKTDNMTQALEKIKEVMKTLEDVYKNQLDALYNDKFMDVDVEIEVLQNMAGM